MSMTRHPNQAYDPPVKDPREEGLQHWDTLRTELMVTRDALRSSEIDRTSQARRIDDLVAENRRLTDLREIDRNECIELRTQIQAGADFFLNILRSGAAKRKGAEAFAPRSHREIVNDQIKQIEETLPKFLQANPPIPPEGEETPTVQ